MASGRSKVSRAGLKIAALRATSWAVGALPAGSGQGLVARRLYEGWLSGRASGDVCALMRGGARFRLDVSDRTQAEVFLTREYEPPLRRFIISRLMGGGTFLDVGAHVGLISISVAAALKGRASVHAFEPDPTNAARFRANLALNPGLRVTLNELAVGGEPGRALLERSLDDRALGRVVARDQDAGEHAIDVPVVTVDQYLASRRLDRVSVLKVDVEGFEPSVLAGAATSLAEQRIGCVICELNEDALSANGWSGDTIREVLSGHGYAERQLPAVGLRRVFPRRGIEVRDLVFVPGSEVGSGS